MAKEANRLHITTEKVSFDHFDLKVSFDVASTSSLSVSFPVEAFVFPYNDEDGEGNYTYDECSGFLITGPAYVEAMNQPLRKAGRTAAAQLLKKSTINQKGVVIFIPKSAGRPTRLDSLAPCLLMDDVRAKIPYELFGVLWRQPDDD